MIIRICSCLLIIGMLGCHTIRFYDGIYTSYNDQLICISSDTLSYKLDMKGGINTYNIGLAYLDKKVLKKSSRSDFTSKICLDTIPNGIKLHIGTFNEFLVEMLEVRITDSLGHYWRFSVDEEGSVLINRCVDENGLTIERGCIERWYGKSINLSVKSPDFETTKQLVFREGFIYTITPKIIYPFTVNSDAMDFKIRQINEDSLIVSINNDKRKVYFTKIHSSGYCTEALFQD